MTKESIKQFFRPNWRKEAVFGAFLILGWICFLGILDVSDMADIFFLLPFAIILEVFSQILEPYTFLAGMIFSLIYWYIFSCLLISLSDVLVKIFAKRFSAKDTRIQNFSKSKLHQKLNKGISARIGIITIVLVAIIAGAGILAWQYFSIREKIVEIPKEDETSQVLIEEKDEGNTYLSPDNFLYAQIIPVGKTQESIVQIYTKDNILLQKSDYTSEDGDHGLVINHASWTPDSKFFIYSAYSSGGHQPWFSRIYFYSKFDNEMYYFQDVSGFTAANDEFIVTSPDIITLTVYTSIGMGPTTKKSFKLNEIISKKDETSGWIIYTNEEYGFEVKYPNDWEKCFSEDKKILLRIIPPISDSDIPEAWDYDYFKSNACMYGSVEFDVEQRKDFNLEKLKKYYSDLYEDSAECDPEILIKETIFNGYHALNVGSCDLSGMYSGTMTVFLYNQTEFRVHVSSSAVRTAGQEIINQMLSSFKFVGE